MSDSREPEADEDHGPFARRPRAPRTESEPVSLETAPEGWVPDFSPDPEEPPRVELWSAVGDVPPWGTVLVLLACGIVFAAQAWRGEVGNVNALIAWGASLRGGWDADTAWRLLASTFLHSGGYHLFLNAISLVLFGAAVEALYARPSFWLVYAGGGAFASLASFLVRSLRATDAGVSVGASGAIFALAGAVLAAAWRLRGRLGPGRARALFGAMLFLVAQSLAGGVEKPNTDNVAHLAGLLAGALIGLLVPLNARLGSATGASRVSRAVAAGLGWMAVLTLGAAFAVSLRRGLAMP